MGTRRTRSERHAYVVAAAAVAVAAWTLGVSGQPRADAAALAALADTERAFAARALVVGWKQAFLEYFADDATGFDGTPGPAKDQIRKNPDPPKELQLIWEPRYGDIAAGADLGYLTGPVVTRLPGRPERHSNYASIWKRQADGTFKVVIDVGIPTPAAVPFPAGFTRAPLADRYTRGGGATDQTTLRDADRALTAAALKGQADAYRGRIAAGARLHRPGSMPAVGEAEILKWLASQRPYASGASEYAEVARSGDLGYTWGSYSLAAAGTTPAERGYYARVWSRSADGAWKIALDVLQPGPPPQQQ